MKQNFNSYDLLYTIEEVLKMLFNGNISGNTNLN